MQKPDDDQRAAPAAEVSLSPTRLRFRRFRRIRRGYYSFLLICFAYFLSFFANFLINNRAVLVKYNGEYYVPVLSFYEATTFGQTEVDGERQYGEANYRALQRQFAAAD